MSRRQAGGGAVSRFALLDIILNLGRLLFKCGLAGVAFMQFGPKAPRRFLTFLPPEARLVWKAACLSGIFLFFSQARVVNRVSQSRDNGQGGDKAAKSETSSFRHTHIPTGHKGHKGHKGIAGAVDRVSESNGHGWPTCPGVHPCNLDPGSPLVLYALWVFGYAGMTFPSYKC